MASWDDVRAIALALPGAEEAVSRELTVWKAGRMFAGERPLRAKEVAEIGPVDEPILLVRVESEAEKYALIAEDPERFFTVSHFDGYPMVLVRLDRVDRVRLVELVESAWATVAPASAVARHFDSADSQLRTEAPGYRPASGLGGFFLSCETNPVPNSGRSDDPGAVGRVGAAGS